MILWVGSYKHILPGNKNDRTMQKPLFFLVEGGVWQLMQFETIISPT